MVYSHIIDPEVYINAQEMADKHRNNVWMAYTLIAPDKMPNLIWHKIPMSITRRGLTLQIERI